MRAPLIASVLCALTPALALAQGHGGVSSSGMGQGEARITSRSDVRLAMESVPGTSGAAITALGQRVGARMATLRGCYEAVVAERPGVTGRLRLRVSLAERGRPSVEVAEDGVRDAPLVRCITEALVALDCADVPRPMGAIVQLEMGNSAAAGVPLAEARAREAQEVTITMDGEHPTSQGGSASRGVGFTLTGQGRESAPAVVAAHRAILTALPGLMDCHRRAARRGQDPSGELTAAMTMREGRAPTSRVTRSTVADERARLCVTRALQGIERADDAGRGPVAVRITFGPAEVVEGAE